ncbi:MAG: hypothetical protein MRJ92_07940 [Nitrospira sp.]|nr:hypothetical protein [Nitrospira sp.]
MVTFEQLVRHHAQVVQTSSAGRPMLQAEFQEKFSKRNDRRHFLPWSYGVKAV